MLAGRYYGADMIENGHEDEDEDEEDGDDNDHDEDKAFLQAEHLALAHLLFISQ